jgi:hypothetical protein
MRRGASLNSFARRPSYVIVVATRLVQSAFVKRIVSDGPVNRAHCGSLEWKSALLPVSEEITPKAKVRVRVLAMRTAEHLARTQQLDAAAHILENYLSVHGADAEILRTLGAIRLRQGRAGEAALLLERALARHFECTAARRGARAGSDAHEPAEDGTPAADSPPDAIGLSA